MYTLVVKEESASRPRGSSIMAFDLDHTLIQPNGSYIFPKSIDDWKWKTGVKDRLMSLVDQGHELLIITNQAALTPDEVHTKASMLYQDLQRPFLLAAGHQHWYRKPHRGLYHVIQTETRWTEPIRLYVGDMETDLFFARNHSIPFQWASEFFSESLPKKQLQKQHEAEIGLHPLMDVSYSPVVLPYQTSPHLFVFVGPPASGKSFMAKEAEKKGYVVINGDTMTAYQMKKTFQSSLKDNKSLVIDNTNADRTVRDTWTIPAREKGYKVTMVWLDLPKPVAMFLNQYRVETMCSGEKDIPDVVYHVYYKKLTATPPCQDEADELIHHTSVSIPEDQIKLLWF